MDNDEIEAIPAVCCRICFCHDGETGEELISPCMCKGTQQFVHQSCLDSWCTSQSGFAFYHCTTCKGWYHFQANKGKSWRKMRFCIGLARDALNIFLVLQIIIAVFGALAALVGTKQMFDMSAMQPLPFYYCLGLFILFMLVGLFVLIVRFIIKIHNTNFMTTICCCCSWLGFLICFPSWQLAWFTIFIIITVVAGMMSVLYILFFEMQRSWRTHKGILREEESKEHLDLYEYDFPPYGMAPIMEDIEYMEAFQDL